MILTGIARIGRDANIIYLANGTAVCNLSLVFNYGQKKDGKRESQWIDSALFGVRAEKLSQYLLKGTQISVVLSDPHIQTFIKNDGTLSSKLAATVLDIELIGSKEIIPPATKPAPPATKPGLQVTRPFDELDELGDLDIPFN